MWSQVSRWISYPLGWLFLMLVPLAIIGASNTSGASSRVNQFTIERFDAAYDARPGNDGRLGLEVTERIVVNFPHLNTNRGIERRLDAKYGDTNLRISGFVTTDESGENITYSRRTADDGDIVIRIGDPNEYVTGRQVYVINYTIGHAMVGVPGRQEIYLDVNGTGWLQPFGEVTATLTVDPSLSGRLLGEQACYRGLAGSTARCEITREGATFRASAAGLGPRETVTIAVGFQPDTVRTTLPLPRLSGPPVGWVIVAMPVVGALALGVSLLMRHIRRRTYHANQPIVTQFTPPDGLAPIAGADFLGRPETGGAAQLVDLVVKGQARLTDPDPDPDKLDDLLVELTVDDLGNRRLTEICENLFGTGRPRRLSDVSGSLSVTVATQLRREYLAGLGLRKAVVAPGWLLGLGLTAVILLGWYALARGAWTMPWLFLSVGLLAVMMLVAAAHYYPRIGRLTPRGREVRNHLLGLQDFVMMAEAGRIAYLQSTKEAPRIAGSDDQQLVRLYEPLLPWAIIFGAEKTWSDLLGRLHDTFDEHQRIGIGDVAQLALVSASEPDAAWLFDRRDDTRSSWWDNRPSWGEGWVANTSRSIGEAIASWEDNARQSRDDDSGGGWWGGAGSSSSSSWSSSSSGGSSGGGSSGGGIGGGGGGGW